MCLFFISPFSFSFKYILNSKGEFGRCHIPRLTIEPDQYRQKVKEIEDKKVEEEEDKKWKELVSKIRSVRANQAGQQPPPRDQPPHNTNICARPVPTPTRPGKIKPQSDGWAARTTA